MSNIQDMAIATTQKEQFEILREGRIIIGKDGEVFVQDFAIKGSTAELRAAVKHRLERALQRMTV